MAEVDLSVAGKKIRLACEDGQEAHLTAMASRLDAHAKQLAKATPSLAAPGGEAKLLLMAGLMLADEAHEAETRLASAPKQSDKNATQMEALAIAMMDQAAAEMRDVAARLDRIAPDKANAPQDESREKRA